MPPLRTFDVYSYPAGHPDNSTQIGTVQAASLREALEAALVKFPPPPDTRIWVEQSDGCDESI